VLSAGILLAGTFGLFWALVIPTFAEQATVFVDRLHEFEHRTEVSTTGLAHRAVTEVFAWPQSPQARDVLRQSWTWGRAIVDGASGLGLLFILTLYLLLDGKRLYAWLLSYVPRRLRSRVADTVPEVSAVVRAYVRGQVITSVVCGLYAWGTLSFLRVPAAVPLAVLAAVLDVLPVLGFLCSVVPAALFALTVSPAAALGVLALYVAYHLFENYMLAPRVYGRQLRLSALTVLLSILVGGELGGVLGAVLILPIVAAYPIVERRWLRDYLAPETLQDHETLDRPEEEGTARAADRVITGRASSSGPAASRPDH
jgi:predicted PurR-regulated permease PerM